MPAAFLLLLIEQTHFIHYTFFRGLLTTNLFAIPLVLSHLAHVLVIFMPMFVFPVS